MKNDSVRSGFTLVEVSIVLFVLGLILWTVAPRLASYGTAGRESAVRAFASASEAAFDSALFEKRAVRLSIDPRTAKYRFVRSGNDAKELPPPSDFGAGVRITRLSLDGISRPLDIPAEIDYRAGGRLPQLSISLADDSGGGAPAVWILEVSPADGGITITEAGASGGG